MAQTNDIVITGIGIVSSLAEGADAHWDMLGAASAAAPAPAVDEQRFAPYPIHPLIDVDFSKQIPRKGDQRQMEPWQRTGVYAAGLALEDAGIKGDLALLDKAGMVVAAGNGERDTGADAAVLHALAEASDPQATLNELLPREIRPTLYLAQQSQLLAGNISIIHKVTGSSRTLKGEEIAGVQAAELAMEQMRSGACEVMLMGASCNAAREDLLLTLELGHKLLHGAFKPVWQRGGAKTGGDKNGIGTSGLVLGSMGVFLVLETRAHAEARGAKCYAKLSAVVSGRCEREYWRDLEQSLGPAAENASELFTLLGPALHGDGSLAVLSGAGGTEHVTADELGFLKSLENFGYQPAIRAYGSMLGHGLEAQFPAGLALAALALSRGKFYAPFDVASGVETPFTGPLERILVTGFGHWRGEGLGVVEACDPQ